MAPKQFPQDFKWGTATASYQIEGAWNVDGKGESIWDRFSHTPGRIKTGETGDIACNHYKLWKTDIALMKKMNLNAYRFSIAWSRIFPEGRGKVNEKGISFYSKLVDELLKNDITPYCTLFHWDLPQALQDLGGWVNRYTVDWFADYAGLMAEKLGDRIKQWITLNEPSIFSSCGYEYGVHAPGVSHIPTSRQVVHHLLIGHGLAGRAIKAKRKDNLVGIAPNLAMDYPATDSPQDIDFADRCFDTACNYVNPFFKKGYTPEWLKNFKRQNNTPLMRNGDDNLMKGPTDFLGINFYFSNFHNVKADGSAVNSPPSAVKKTDLGWPIHPQGLKDLLVKITKRYGKIPIYITENGAAYYNEKPDSKGAIHDSKRRDYLKGHIKALEESIAAGVNLKGYFVWSFMDNFEWAEGTKPRFGIVHVDYKTQKRRIKNSGLFYSEVARLNALPGE